jgi:hypothetical protein
MPRIRGKDASNKGPSSGTQLEQGEGPIVSSRAPQKKLGRQEKRQSVARALSADAKRRGVKLDGWAQSVGKRPRGQP